LHLAANHFGPHGAEALAKGDWPNLIKLQIYDCSLGDEGIRNLVKNPWPKVKELHICNL
jgi:Ran GTPase-activating protein (RanGAP) involved in mRNA processing and transport